MCLSRYICCTKRQGMTRVLALRCSVMSAGRVKVVSAAHDGFLQAQKSTSKCRCTCFGDADLYDKTAWAFLIGTHADALGRLAEQRATPGGC